MRRIWFAMILLAVSATIAHAQLTADQRVADLTQLANLYAKNYGPYEWKRDALKSDLLVLTPWLERARNATDDLDYQDLLIEYIASLNDAHDLVAFPTTFFARLPFTIDIYDGKVLIDSISRADMPVQKYPFTIGDEFVQAPSMFFPSEIRLSPRFRNSRTSWPSSLTATRIVSCGSNVKRRCSPHSTIPTSRKSMAWSNPVRHAVSSWNWWMGKRCRHA